jgi:hypothetical protein
MEKSIRGHSVDTWATSANIRYPALAQRRIERDMLCSTRYMGKPCG